MGASTAHNPMRLHGMLQGYLYLFYLTFIFTPRPLYPRGKSPRNALYWTLGGPQSWSERFGVKKNLVPRLGIECSPSLYRQSCVIEFDMYFHASCSLCACAGRAWLETGVRRTSHEGTTSRSITEKHVRHLTNCKLINNAKLT
jgi:hypothetical protein